MPVDHPQLDIPAVARRELLQDDRFSIPLWTERLQRGERVYLCHQIAAMAVAALHDERERKVCQFSGGIQRLAQRREYPCTWPGQVGLVHPLRHQAAILTGDR